MKGTGWSLSARLRGVWVLGAHLLCLAPPATSVAGETVGADRLAALSWEYSLGTRALLLKGCGQFRPGDQPQCATVTLRGKRTTEQVARILRLPKDRVGIVIEPGEGGFAITALSMNLLKAPGLAERAATGKEVVVSGESLTEVSWIYHLRSQSVTLRVCGKLANPEHTGCAERDERHEDGIDRLLEILLLEPVEKLAFHLGWDDQGRRFTRILRISLTAR
jgi:hypothetical protein